MVYGPGCQRPVEIKAVPQTTLPSPSSPAPTFPPPPPPRGRGVSGRVTAPAPAAFAFDFVCPGSSRAEPPGVGASLHSGRACPGTDSQATPPRPGSSNSVSWIHQPKSQNTNILLALSPGWIGRDHLYSLPLPWALWGSP